MVIFMATNTNGCQVECISQLIIIFLLLASPISSVAASGKEVILHGWVGSGGGHSFGPICCLAHPPLESAAGIPTGLAPVIDAARGWFFRKHTELPTASCPLCCFRGSGGTLTPGRWPTSGPHTSLLQMSSSDWKIVSGSSDASGPVHVQRVWWFSSIATLDCQGGRR